MPMVAGSVAIDPVTAVATGTGYVKAVYDALEAAQDFGTLTGPSLANSKQLLADVANTLAPLITHLQSAAVVSTASAGVIPPDPIAWSGTGTGTIA